MSNAERSARHRAKGKTVTVVLELQTYDLLQTLQQQLEMTQAQAITAALRALSPAKATRAVSDAEVEVIFDSIEAAAAKARQLRAQS